MNTLHPGITLVLNTPSQRLKWTVLKQVSGCVILKTPFQGVTVETALVTDIQQGLREGVLIAVNEKQRTDRGRGRPQ